ncbi:MAG: A/G-specific adenine glycosylase [Desulfobacterales bacterium]|nr:A/G-specific adenine glycosylase [Desulfobacterales bacterium]MDD4394180.1 A/G-specific adenine glycosylase [Desulfobacterales bacterium]
MNSDQIHGFCKRLILWYNTHHRHLPWRQTDNPYRIWVSEVMLQQTQVKTVVPYYRKFVTNFPDIHQLAGAGLQDVLKAWEGLGYYARARNLHRAAQLIFSDYSGQIPDSFKAFKQLPGVGDYIASAVLSIAFHQPYSVVDGNVKRVLSRLFQIDVPVNQSSSYAVFRQLAESLLDRNSPGVFNQAMMELGALVCRPGSPDCAICPVQSACSACQHGHVDVYPRRVIKKAVPEYRISAGVIQKDDLVLITRRKLDGLLGGLWEFPGGKAQHGEDAESACIREIREEVNLEVEIEAYITRVRHAYTHFKIVMDVFKCRYVSGDIKLNGPMDYRWIAMGEIDRYPFPKANHKFIPLIRLCD